MASFEEINERFPVIGAFKEAGLEIASALQDGKLTREEIAEVLESLGYVFNAAAATIRSA